MRIHVVTPKAPVNVTLNPRVQPAPSPCPVFVTGIQEPVRLSQSSYWILRLPYPFSSKLIFKFVLFMYNYGDMFVTIRYLSMEWRFRFFSQLV